MSNWNTLSRLSGPNATKDFLASMATAEKFLNPGKRKRANPSAPPAEENPYPAPDLPPLREPEPAPRMDPDGADAAEVARLKRELARQRKAYEAQLAWQQARIAELEGTDLRRALHGAAAREGVILAEILGAPRALKRSVR